MFSDSDEVCNIVDVARVFVVEERMKDITFDTETGEIVKEQEVNIAKKIKFRQPAISHRIGVLTVKGLN